MNLRDDPRVTFLRRKFLSQSTNGFDRMIQELQRQKEEVKNVTSYSYQGRATNHHFFL